MKTDKRNPNRNPPYNTGKVKIGIAYIPPQLNHHTEETDFWQGVYMGDLRAARRERMWWVAYAAVCALGFIVGYWLLRGM